MLRWPREIQASTPQGSQGSRSRCWTSPSQPSGWNVWRLAIRSPTALSVARRWPRYAAMAGGFNQAPFWMMQLYIAWYDLCCLRILKQAIACDSPSKKNAILVGDNKVLEPSDLGVAYFKVRATLLIFVCVQFRFPWSHNSNGQWYPYIVVNSEYTNPVDMMGGMGHHEQDQSHYPLVNIQKAIEHGHGNSGFTWIYPLIAWWFPIVNFVCLPGRVIWGGLLRVSIVLRDLSHSKPIWTQSQTGHVDRQTSCDCRFSPSTTSTQFEQQGAGLDLQVPFFRGKEQQQKGAIGTQWWPPP